MGDYEIAIIGEVFLGECRLNRKNEVKRITVTGALGERRIVHELISWAAKAIAAIAAIIVAIMKIPVLQAKILEMLGLGGKQSGAQRASGKPNRTKH